MVKIETTRLTKTMGNFLPDGISVGFMTFTKRPGSEIMSSDVKGEIVSIYNLQKYCSKGSKRFRVVILSNLERRA